MGIALPLASAGKALASGNVARILVAEWHRADQFMATAPPEDKTRVTMRVPTELRQTLEEAARLQGATLNAFVVQAAFEEAQRILERESVIRLSRESAETVFSLMENPPKPNEKLKAAAKTFKKLVRV